MNEHKRYIPQAKSGCVELTWGELVGREPQLSRLLEFARHVDPKKVGPKYCKEDVWYGRSRYPNFHKIASLLAGMWAESDDVIVRSEGALMLAKQTVYDALPPCECHPIKVKEE
jgi:hypothetical protein